MKVSGVTFLDNGQRVLVTLRPSWLARVLGKPLRVVELLKDEDALMDHKIWRSQHTNRWLRDMEFGSMIRDALEAQSVTGLVASPVALPQARIVTGGIHD